MKVMLCGKPGRCCPSIEKINDSIVIFDDYEGIAKFTLEEWELLKEKILSGVI